VDVRDSPWYVHSWCGGPVCFFRALQDDAVFAPEIDLFLCVEGAVFCRLEGTGAGETDALTLGLGDVYDARAVGSAVADGLYVVDEGYLGQAAEDEVASHALSNQAC